MSTHKLARRLELTSKILLSLPDSDIDTALCNILSALTPQKDKQPNNKKSPPTNHALKLKTKFDEMSISEIEHFLTTQDFSTGELSKIAKDLGVAASKRQNKPALINLIVRFFESNSLDTIMRASRVDGG